MNKDAALYDRTQNLQGVLFQGALNYNPPPPAELPPLLQVRRGYAESPGWLLVQAVEFDPQPLTLERLRGRHVYGSERILRALLDLMATEGWFTVAGDTYSVTPDGRTMYKLRTGRIYAMLDGYEPRPRADLERIADLLGRVLEAAGDSWSLRYSRRRAPGPDAHPTMKIFHHCADLNALRDDAHMAAFQPHCPQGYAWEAFALACGGETTAAAIGDQLHYRGYWVQEYAEALDGLVARSWLERDGEAYRVSDAGWQVRAQVEEDTNRYFYAPWSVLSPAEDADLCNFLVTMTEG